MLGTVGEVRKNSLVMYSSRLRHIFDRPAKIYIHQLRADTVEDLQRLRADRDE